MQGIARVEEVVVLDELCAQPLATLHEGAEIVLELLTYLKHEQDWEWKTPYPQGLFRRMMHARRKAWF
jgi:hypothetical protein